MFRPLYKFRVLTRETTKNLISGTHGGTRISTGAIAGIAVGCSVLVLGLIVLAVYALRQKNRAEKAIGQSRPFGKKTHSQSFVSLTNTMYILNSPATLLIFFMFQLPGHRVAKIAKAHRS